MCKQRKADLITLLLGMIAHLARMCPVQLPFLVLCAEGGAHGLHASVVRHNQWEQIFLAQNVYYVSNSYVHKDENCAFFVDITIVV